MDHNFLFYSLDESRSSAGLDQLRHFLTSSDHSEEVLACRVFSQTCSEKPFRAVFFVEQGAARLLLPLLESPEPIVRLEAITCLWNLSALSENKVTFVQDGILDKVLSIFSNITRYYHRESVSVDVVGEDGFTAEERLDMAHACSAIIQNVSEYQFRQGQRNPNQVRIVHHTNVLSVLLPWMNRTYVSHASQHLGEDGSERLEKEQEKMISMRFLACLTAANLSMDPRNHELIHSSNVLPAIQSFAVSKDMNYYRSALFLHWLSLEPITPLLSSPFPAVQTLSVASLVHFSDMPEYRSKKIYRSFALNRGFKSLQHIYVSAASDSPLRSMITTILKNLDMEALIPSSEAPASSSSSSYSMFSESPSALVASDLSTLLDDPAFSDITLIVDGERFQMHKAILYARCPSFRALFKSKLAESQSNELVLSSEEVANVSAAVFGDMCKYLYTGNPLVVTASNALELMVLSDRFGLTQLKEVCEDCAAQNVTAESFGVVLGLADRYNCEHLMQSLLRFAERYPVDDLHELYPEWDSSLSIEKAEAEEGSHLSVELVARLGLIQEEKQKRAAARNHTTPPGAGEGEEMEDSLAAE